MAPRSDLSAVAVGAAAAGAVLIWSGIKGASVLTTLTELIRGQRPSGENVYPIDTTSESSAGGIAGGAAAAASGAAAEKILQVAASKKGQCYQFGAGHSGDPCTSKCSDCSSYVCCVIGTATGRKINMNTGGLAGLGTGVPYEQRQPGDIIVWNGGTGGGHTGIIATVKGKGGTMWNNSCSGCGGVHISKYPYPGRSAAAAVVRRV